jgi:Transposase zinc-ribbon domain
MIGPSVAVTQSLAEFQKIFPDEESCAAYLFRRRWPGGFVCPGCDCRRAASLKSRAHIYECFGCRRQTSITAGTVMHGSKLPLPVWFQAAHLFATHPVIVSARLFERLFGVTYKSAWLLREKYRQSMAAADREPLKGLVEVGHTGVKFRGETSGIIVAGAMRSLEIRLAAMTDESPASVEAFVRATVKCGATLLTDGHKSYFGLSDYRHADPHQARERLQLPITFSLLTGFRRRWHDPVDNHLDRFVLFHNNLCRQVSFDTVLGFALAHAPSSATTLV